MRTKPSAFSVMAVKWPVTAEVDDARLRAHEAPVAQFDGWPGRVAREVLRAIREAGRVSTGDIIEATGRSRLSVRAQLSALESAGLIQWNGHSPKDPRAYWTVKVE